MDVGLKPMKRHTKIVAIVILGAALVTVGSVLMLSRPEKSGFIESIPYLAHRKAASESDMLTFTSGPRAFSNKSHATEFVVDEDFNKVHEALKKELKPRASIASAYPTKNPSFTMYGFGSVGKPGSRMISVKAVQKKKTSITVIEQQTINPLDQMKMWFSNLKKGSRGGITVFTNQKNGRTAILSDP